MSSSKCMPPWSQPLEKIFGRKLNWIAEAARHSFQMVSFWVNPNTVLWRIVQWARIFSRSSSTFKHKCSVIYIKFKKSNSEWLGSLFLMANLFTFFCWQFKKWNLLLYLSWKMTPSLSLKQALPLTAAWGELKPVNGFCLASFYRYELYLSLDIGSLYNCSLVQSVGTQYKYILC